MRLVPIENIKEGMYLGDTIYDANGRVLLKKGIELNDVLIKRIEGIGIQSLYVTDEFSNQEVEDIITPQVKNKAIKTVKETFDTFSKHHNFVQKEGTPNRFKEKKLQKSKDENIEAVNHVAKDIVDDVIASKNMMVNLVDIKTIDDYTYRHSVNVAVLSLVIGMQMNLNKNELYDLCIGALLHDIGKIFIPTNILMKKDKLTSEEFAVVKTHTIKGYEYLKNGNLSSTAKVISIQHHERIDGSGYPDGKTGDAIHKLAKIVAIADVYDALTSDRPYRSAKPQNEALEYIMGSAGRNFDFQMAQIFSRKIVPYPVGSLVKLSNGDTGVIEEIPGNYPLRPKVKIIRKNMYNIFEIDYIDLLQEKNIVIEGIEHELPEISAKTNY